jgi:hypothetical protein
MPIDSYQKGIELQHAGAVRFGRDSKASCSSCLNKRSRLTGSLPDWSILLRERLARPFGRLSIECGVRRSILSFIFVDLHCLLLHDNLLHEDDCRLKSVASY